MATEFRLPDLGENIESGDVVNVLVNEGDEIQPEQNIVEIETDKATVEVPCPIGGRVAKIHVKAGDTIEIGGLLITVDESGAGGGEEEAEEKPAPAKKSAPDKAKPSAKKLPEREDEPADDEEDASAPEPARAERPAANSKSTERPPAKPSKPASSLPAGRSDEDGAEEDEAPPARPAPRKAPAKTSAGDELMDDGATPARKSSNGAAAKPAAVSMPPRGESSETAAGPATRRLARELGVDLKRIAGTGPDGRITRDDVVAAVRGTPQAGPAPASAPSASKAPSRTPPALPGIEGDDNFGKIRREKMSRIRKTIAANMSRSANTIPHLTNFDDVDITELDEIRRESAADYQGVSIKLTMMPFVMKAVAHALKLHPMLNASLDDVSEEIVYKEYVNLGIAADTPKGLVVPVVRNVDQMSIPQIAHAMARVAEQARSNQFTLDELRGGTFTISNLGAVGGTYSTPIINHPEVAILLIGRSRKLPVVIDDQIRIRLMMPLSLSYDHRVVDGATAARFLNEVISLLNTPGRLLLSPLAG